MINLLSPTEKKNFVKEENWKVVLTLVILFIFFLICLSLIILSVKVVISGEASAQRILFEQRQFELENQQMKDFQNSLDEKNKTVVALNVFYKNQFIPSDVLKKISATLPVGVYLTNISISPQSGKDVESSCVIAGFSPTRDLLLEFKSNLEMEKSFVNILFPPKSWIEQNDISFTINFDVKE